MSERIEQIVEEYRRRHICGECIDLRPLNRESISEIVAIRNQEKNKYYLNQSFHLTEEDQNEWFESYLRRKNDIYWCIYNKEEKFIGTIRVYDIDEKEDICNQGSFMIYEEASVEAPYAIEAEILSLDFIFDTLRIDKVINENRIDNKVMNNLSRKLGFDVLKKMKIREVEYNYCILQQKNYREARGKFVGVIDYWKTRWRGKKGEMR